MNTYSIIVQNKSGRDQDYALFSSPPEIQTGGIKPKIWTNVFAVGKAPDTAVTNFTMYKQYYGVVGQSVGQPGDAVTVNVSQQRPVTLGKAAADGTSIPGTTLEFAIASNDAPTFAKVNPENSSEPNSFAITTPDFDSQKALLGNWLIGLGGADPTGTNFDTVSATFIPEPQVVYNIQPSNTYYLIPGSYTKSKIIDYTKIGKKLAIDFTLYPTGVVTVVHDSHGNLTIQKR